MLRVTLSPLVNGISHYARMASQETRRRLGYYFVALDGNLSLLFPADFASARAYDWPDAMREEAARQCLILNARTSALLQITPQLGARRSFAIRTILPDFAPPAPVSDIPPILLELRERRLGDISSSLRRKLFMQKLEATALAGSAATIINPQLGAPLMPPETVKETYEKVLRNELKPEIGTLFATEPPSEPSPGLKDMLGDLVEIATVPQPKRFIDQFR